MKLRIKRLTDTATIPTKAHLSDACFDIYADSEATILPKQSAIVHTGFATEIPNGWFAAVYPRSSMGCKRHLRLSNSTGVIDSAYRGEWLVSLYNDGDETQIINHGDRIAQFAFLPVPDVWIEEVDELTDSERGQGGFGSTGK